MTKLIQPWTDASVAHLRELFERKATLLGAAGAMKRSRGSVQVKARQLGILFPGVRAVRAEMKAKIVAAENRDGVPRV